MEKTRRERRQRERKKRGNIAIKEQITGSEERKKNGGRKQLRAVKAVYNTVFIGVILTAKV